MGEWKTVGEDLMRLLRPRTLPVALKFCESVEDMTKIPRVRRPERARSFCQLVTATRHWGWTMGATVEDFGIGASNCAAMLGLRERAEGVRNGTFRSIYWHKTKEEAKKFEDAWPTIPTGKFKAIVLSPLAGEKFNPDMVLIYGKPLQIVLLLSGMQFEHYERYDFHCVGESSCADYVAQCYLTGKPALSIPCWGESRIGGGYDDEIVMAWPGNLELAKSAIRGVEALSSPAGVRYPAQHIDVPVDEFFSKEYLDIFAGKTK